MSVDGLHPRIHGIVFTVLLTYDIDSPTIYRRVKRDNGLGFCDVSLVFRWSLLWDRCLMLLFLSGGMTMDHEFARKLAVRFGTLCLFDYGCEDHGGYLTTCFSLLGRKMYKWGSLFEASNNTNGTLLDSGLSIPIPCTSSNCASFILFFRSVSDVIACDLPFCRGVIDGSLDTS